jgi:hypothetical protein
MNRFAPPAQTVDMVMNRVALGSPLTIGADRQLRGGDELSASPGRLPATASPPLPAADEPQAPTTTAMASDSMASRPLRRRPAGSACRSILDSLSRSSVRPPGPPTLGG